MAGLLGGESQEGDGAIESEVRLSRGWYLVTLNTNDKSIKAGKQLLDSTRKLWVLALVRVDLVNSIYSKLGYEYKVGKWRKWMQETVSKSVAGQGRGKFGVVTGEESGI